MGRIRDRSVAKAMEVMGSMAGAAGDAQQKSLAVIREDFEKLIDNQNEHTLALVTIYRAVEAIASHQKVRLPVPLIKMRIEGEEQP